MGKGRRRMASTPPTLASLSAMDLSAPEQLQPTQTGNAGTSTSGSSSVAFKIVLLGEGRVGKTSLLLRFTKTAAFDERQVPTIQAAFLKRTVRVDAMGKYANAELNIWDTAGQERFHALGPIYYRDADAALHVFDIADQDSFERVRLWVKELKANAASTSSSPPLLFIAANKADLEHKRAVPMKDVEALARSIGDGAGGSGEPAPIFSTSAKTDKGVEAAFMDVARRLLVRHLRNEQRWKSNQNRGGSKRLVIQDDPLPRP